MGPRQPRRRTLRERGAYLTQRRLTDDARLFAAGRFARVKQLRRALEDVESCLVPCNSNFWRNSSGPFGVRAARISRGKPSFVPGDFLYIRHQELAFQVTRLSHFGPQSTCGDGAVRAPA